MISVRCSVRLVARSGRISSQQRRVSRILRRSSFDVANKCLDADSAKTMAVGLRVSLQRVAIAEPGELIRSK